MIPELCLHSPLANSSLPTGFCVGTIPVPLNMTRSIVSLKHNSFLALERSIDSIVWISKSTLNGSDSDHNNWKKQILVTEADLNHGLAMDSDFIYASTDADVYRWAYHYDDISQNFTSIGTGNTSREHIIYNISSNGTGWTPYAHMTRTLLFSRDNQFLYISVGSMDNVDADSYRSRIRRFNTSSFVQSSELSASDNNASSVLGNNTSTGLKKPVDFDIGEVYVDGVRNIVAMAFDKNDVLWGADNGPSNLTRYDLGGNLSDDNPADRLFQFSDPIGKHYGYPYCFAEYLFPDGYGNGRGTSWVWPSFLNGKMNNVSKTVTDEECRTEYVQATIAMQGHVAPLGMTFYTYPETRPEYCQNILPFPQSMDGYAFIALHGSSPRSRAIPVGYSVVYIPMPLTYDTIYKNDPVPLLRYNSNTTSKWENDFRPVDVKFDDCGCLLVTSDGSKAGNYSGSRIVRIHFYDENATALDQNRGVSSGSINLPFLSRSVSTVLCFSIFVLLFS